VLETVVVLHLSSLLDLLVFLFCFLFCSLSSVGFLLSDFFLFSWVSDFLGVASFSFYVVFIGDFWLFSVDPMIAPMDGLA